LGGAGLASARVTKISGVMDLKKGRKANPYRSAVSMISFYENWDGKKPLEIQEIGAATSQEKTESEIRPRVIVASPRRIAIQSKITHSHAPRIQKQLHLQTETQGQSHREGV
jgi:hypothetical protein